MSPEINTLVTACSSFTCVCIAIGWIIKIIGGIRQPEENQNARIEKLEAEMTQVKRCLDNDNTKIKSMEHGNRIMLESLQALVNHAIDGNNIEELKEKSHDLSKYLYDKGFSGK